MDDSKLTPDQRVRLQLQRSLTQDVIKKSEAQRAFDKAIKPLWVAEGGKAKQLGQDPAIAKSLPNRYYAVGEAMRPIPTGQGVLSADNRSYFEIVPPIAPPAPPVNNGFLYRFIINNEVLYTDALGNTAIIDYLPIEFTYPLPSKILDLDDFIATNNAFPYSETFNIFGSPFGANFYADPDNNYNEVQIAASGSPSVTAVITPFIQFNSLDSNGFFVAPEEPLTLDFELLSAGLGIVASAYGVVFSSGNEQVNLYSAPQPANIGIDFYVRFKSSSKTNWFEI